MKSALFTLLLLVSINSSSQKWVDLANVYWRTSPANTFPQSTTNQRNFNMYVVDAKAPVVLDSNNLLLFGVEYQHSTINTSPSSILHDDYSFAATMLQLGWEHKWNSKSKMLFMTIPRFNTDYNDVGLGHFQLGGLALGTTSRSENFDWKYGLYYNGELFGPMIVPLFGFNWKVNDQWRFKLTIPVNFELSYHPKQWFRTGLRFDGINASYAYQSVPGLTASDGYIDKADNNAWAFTEFHIGKNIWFHLKGGHSILRKYRFFSDGDKMNLKLGPVNIGDERNSGDPDAVPEILKDGWSIEARMIFRLPL